jgi:CubicO group peptidase (beta-lactamase class C family)
VIRFLALLVASTLALAEPPLPPDKLAAKLDAAVSPLFQRDQPGGAVLFARDGKVIYRKAFGLAERDNGIPLAPDSIFRIGSITKQMTAAAIFRLVDEGKVALEDDITKYLPDYPAKGKHITVHNLLTHSAGLRSYTDILVEPSTLTLDKTVPEIIDDFSNEPLFFEPGEAIRYSNSNYVLLGAIIEKVSGMTYADFMAAKVFEPLGMTATAYEGHERDGRKRVEGYQRGKSKPFEKALPISMTQTYAAGALVSTVDDMAKWGAAIDAKRFLSAESWKQMFKPYVLGNGEVTRACSGWFVERIAFGREVYGHGGGINGFSAMLYWVPEDRVFVTVMLNHVGQTASALHIAQLMLHVALPRRD